MPSQALSISLPGVEFDSFELLNFGSLEVEAGPVRFGFQVDLTPSVLLSQVAFGLIQKDANGSRLGFAVRLDLDRGEIWDMINNSGLIGWIDEPQNYISAASNEPILLSLEVERMGSALLPKLQVGGEEWLYPAVRSTDSLEFVAVAGCGAEHAEGLELFSHAALWQEAVKKA
jgi:hypothetical protein